LTVLTVCRAAIISPCCSVIRASCSRAAWACRASRPCFSTAIPCATIRSLASVPRPAAIASFAFASACSAVRRASCARRSRRSTSSTSGEAGCSARCFQLRIVACGMPVRRLASAAPCCSPIASASALRCVSIGCVRPNRDPLSLARRTPAGRGEPGAPAQRCGRRCTLSHGTVHLWPAMAPSQQSHWQCGFAREQRLVHSSVQHKGLVGRPCGKRAPASLWQLSVGTRPAWRRAQPSRPLPPPRLPSGSGAVDGCRSSLLSTRTRGGPEAAPRLRQMSPLDYSSMVCGLRWSRSSDLPGRWILGR
jgi:hypothetical protein